MQVGFQAVSTLADWLLIFCPPISPFYLDINVNVEGRWRGARTLPHGFARRQSQPCVPGPVANPPPIHLRGQATGMVSACLHDSVPPPERDESEPCFRRASQSQTTSLSPFCFPLNHRCKIVSLGAAVEFYVDLHGHVAKRGCFMYGNHHEDSETMAESVLFPRLLALNTPFFDFGACNFTAKNMQYDPRLPLFVCVRVGCCVGYRLSLQRFIVI